MKLYCDNKSANPYPNNPLYHERTKNIEVDCHFLCEKVESKEVITLFVRSQDQLVDIFTNTLGRN